jgi:hypothetical protein
VSQRLALFLTLSCIYLVAAWYRIQIVEIIEVRSDTLSPLWAAMGVMHHGWSDPPNPESDHWLWVTHLPLLIGRSLREVFVLRCLQAALIAPIGAYAAWRLSRGNILCTLAVGLLLGLDPGLRDTLVVGFRGYGAPEWLALSSLGFILWHLGNKWGILLFGGAWMIASGQHPLTLGCGLSVVLLGVWLRKSPKLLLLFLLSIGICSLPRVFWTVELMQCDSGGIQCLLDIANSSSQQETPEASLLFKGVWDRFNSEWSWFALVGLFGIHFSGSRRLKYWVLSLTLGVVVLGLAIHTLRPYHFRILAAPLIIIAVVGWYMRFPKLANGVVGSWILMMVLGQFDPLGAVDEISVHDSLGRQLSSVDKKVWLKTSHLKGPTNIDPSAVVLSAYLQGWNTGFAACTTTGTVLVIQRQSQQWVLNAERFEEKALSEFENDGSLSMFDAAIRICSEVEL